jgi:hypothetical protein
MQATLRLMYHSLVKRPDASRSEDRHNGRAKMARFTLVGEDGNPLTLADGTEQVASMFVADNQFDETGALIPVTEQITSYPCVKADGTVIDVDADAPQRTEKGWELIKPSAFDSDTTLGQYHRERGAIITVLAEIEAAKNKDDGTNIVRAVPNSTRKIAYFNVKGLLSPFKVSFTPLLKARRFVAG